MRRTIDAAECYWGVLALPMRRAAPKLTRHEREVAGNLFDTMLPAGIDSVHATYLPLTRGLVLACAVAHERMAALALGAGPSDSVGPDAIPAHVQSALGEAHPGLVPDAGAISMLHGAYEPLASRRARARRAAGLLMIACACLATLAAGFERRAEASRHAAREARAASDSIWQALFPDRTAQHPALRMESELRRLRADAARARAFVPPRDVSAELALVLRAWPEDVWLESLRVGQEGTVLTITGPSPDAVASFAAALRDAGLDVAQPSITQSRGLLRGQLRISLHAGTRALARGPTQKEESP
jgi:Tfp pilus assembly protein PilN